MRLTELIEVADFPAVVSGADIAFLRQNPNSTPTRDFLCGYLGFDARSQHALHSAISSLSQTQIGGAFWLNGVFGSGKSHLLGVLALLGEGIGLENFAAAHPECARYFPNFAPRLVLHISLDEFEAEKLGLEEIFWRELEKEWARRGLETLQIPHSGARAETFAALHETLSARNLAGIVVCFDELSLFLGGREHGPLQGDAAFLQFLAGHSRRAPLWVFAALQKTIDDISGLERYSLSQIRDRFTTLPLSLAHVPALVQKRLIRAKNEAEIEAICAQSFDQMAQKLPRLDFGPREWRAAFPFHPATLTLLEAVTSRFFSRTRSAMLFCARALDLEKNASFRVAPDAIWDYFAPELEAHPDLRPLEAVFRSCNDALSDIFSPNDRENGRRTLKFLLLCKVAGQSPTPIQLANALDFELELGGDGAYDYARFLLERLRLRGAFLALERGESPLFDRYAVDLGRRVGEMARRQIQATLETLPAGDTRIAQHVLACCRAEPLPLSGFLAPRSLSVFWQGAARKISVQIWDGAAPQNLANRAATTREMGAPDDAVLAIWPPFGPDDAPLDALFAFLPPEARAALWIWKPRAPARDEWELARESAAAQLALRDPSLGDNRRGRALLEHLQKEAPARELQLARVANRLLLEGEIALGNGAVLEAGELARGESFAAQIEAIGEFAWPHLFPRFPEIAPRARLLTPSNADSLCLEILRRPADAPFFAPSLERLARHIGEPLGIAKSSAGRWKIASGKAELMAPMLEFLGEGAPYSLLEAHFCKSQWGFRAEQIAVLACALLRGGEIAAFDGKNGELESEKIGLPLRRSVHFLRPGRLPDAPTWTKIAVVAREISDIPASALSFEQAQNVATTFLEWREKTLESAELSRARAAQLRRALGHKTEDWPEFEKVSGALGTIFEVLPPRGAAFEVLSRAATLDAAHLREILSLFRRAETQLQARTAPLIALQTLLGHADFVAPPELSPARSELLESLGAGEGVLFDESILAQAEEFTRRYRAAYAQWHAAQNDAARWNSWRNLAQTEAAQCISRLQSVRNRDFGGALLSQIEEELGKRCPRDGALSSGEAVCSSCGLRLGARLILRNPAEIQTQLENALQSLRKSLDESGPRAFLTRQNAPFIAWNGEAQTLLPLLSGAHLRVLDDALAPRRCVVRSLQNLGETLQNGLTKRDFETAFALWLDGGENLGDDDEIELMK